MEPRRRLEANLVSESEAYGYTLAIWGGGALLIDAFGVPGVERSLAFVGGALVAFGALAVVAFQGFSAEARISDSPASLVVSMVHLVSTGGTLVCVHLFVVAARGGPPDLVFAAVGALVTLAYNLLLLLEEVVIQGVV